MERYISHLRYISKFGGKIYLFTQKIYLHYEIYLRNVFKNISLWPKRYIFFTDFSDFGDIFSNSEIYLPWHFSAKRYIFRRYISLKIYLSQRYNSGTQFPEIYLYCTKDISFSRKIISPMLCTSHNFFSSGFVFKFTFKNYSVAKNPSEWHLNENSPF